MSQWLVARRFEGQVRSRSIVRRGSGGGRIVVAVIGLVALLAVPLLPTGAASAPPPPADHAYPTKIRHVVVLVFENQDAGTVYAHGPFFHYLATTYAYETGTYAICHPSAPNYLALTSGATYSQCGSDTHYLYNVTNIADLVQGANLTWGAFDESMPRPCDLYGAYPYAVKHNPLLFYTDVASNSLRCDAHVTNLSRFYYDINTSQVPAYSFITPNLLDDGHDTNLSYADSWLHGFLTPMVNQSFFAQTAFFIVFDEGTTHAGAGGSYKGPTNSTGGGHVYLSIVSPLSVGVGNISFDASDYSVLTTSEWLLGLGTTGHRDRAYLWPPLRGAFS